MARPPIEEPVTQVEGDREVTTHPAFAEIQASRISGGQTLYGSDIQHQHYVAIRIHRSRLHRNLSNDWAFAEIGSMIEVAMSEAQWGEFITSMNSKGAQCTLQSVNGKSIPQLPSPKSRGRQFREEAAKSVEEALQAIKETVTEIEATNLSASKKKALIAGITRVNAALQSSLPFVMDQFVEHMEEQVAKAKAEINGYAQAASGQQSLAFEFANETVTKRLTRTPKKGLQSTSNEVEDGE